MNKTTKKKTIISSTISFMFVFSSLILSVPSTVSSPPQNPLETIYHVPANVLIGDLIFIDLNHYTVNLSFLGWDHVAIYIGNDQFIDAFLQEGVRITNLTAYMQLGVQIAYGHVSHSTPERRTGAVHFAKSQLGKSYQYFSWNFTSYDTLFNTIAYRCNRIKDADPNSDAWYSAELVWATYLHQGIDIEKNGFLPPFWVWPSQISSDNNIIMYTPDENNRLNDWSTLHFRQWLANVVYGMRTIPQTPPAYVQPGDIILFQSPPFHIVNGFWNCIWIHPGYDHTALYVGNITYQNKTIEYCTISAGDPVQLVSYCNLIHGECWSHVDFAQVVTATSEQKQAAIDWALNRIGLRWQNFWTSRKCADPSAANIFANQFYCSELPWAAYYNTTGGAIDIDANGWDTINALDIDDNGHRIIRSVPAVSPSEILADSDVQAYADVGGPVTNQPSGETSPHCHQTCSYTTSAFDSGNQDVFYQWDWGDFVNAWYYVPRGSGSQIIKIHKWNKPGVYEVKVRAKNINGLRGEWSQPLIVNVRNADWNEKGIYFFTKFFVRIAEI